MSGTATNRCCCDCEGMGLPIFTDWKVNRGVWANGNAYDVGDLVFSGSPAAYYVCHSAHTAIIGTNDPPNATYWTAADRALKCLYLEIDNIGFKGCMPLIGIEDGEDETSTGARVRLGEYSIQLNDKWLLRQRKPSPGEDGYQNKLLYLYGGWVGQGCWWQYNCDCDGDIYTEYLVFSVPSPWGAPDPVETWTDSYTSGFTIQIAFTSGAGGGGTEVEVVIFGGLFPYSSGADGDHDPVDGSDIPCKHPTLWMSVSMELFRGTASIPGGWLDEFGQATSTITVNNDWSCSDIGTVLQPGSTPTGHNRPLGRVIVGAGGGTVKLVAPHAAGWEESIGNAAASCGSFADCDGTGGDPPPWDPDPPYPPYPPFPPGPGPGPGPDPRPPPPPPGPRKRRYSPVNKCSGGRYGQWVDTGSYPAGTVLLVMNSIGTLVCVVISPDIFIAEAPPGPMLTGVISNFGARGCSECAACYRLERCDGLVNLFTRDDLSAVVGKVVDVGGECYTVHEAENCPQEDHPSIGEEREDCDDPACGPADPCEDCAPSMEQPDVTVTLNGTLDEDCEFHFGTTSPDGSYPYIGAFSCSFYECCWYWELEIPWEFGTNYMQVFVVYKDGVFTVAHNGTGSVSYGSIGSTVVDLSCEDGVLTGSITIPVGYIEASFPPADSGCPSLTIVWGS